MGHLFKNKNTHFTDILKTKSRFGKCHYAYLVKYAFLRGSKYDLAKCAI